MLKMTRREVVTEVLVAEMKVGLEVKGEGGVMSMGMMVVEEVVMEMMVGVEITMEVVEIMERQMTVQRWYLW